MLFTFRSKPKILVEVSVYIEKDGDVFYAFSPTLPGLHVEGETEEEVIQNAKDAAFAYLVSLIKHKEPLPISRVITEIPINAKVHSFIQQIPAYS
jgi:predicted RNase H-like HicB family nuclease